MTRIMTTLAAALIATSFAATPAVADHEQFHVPPIQQVHLLTQQLQFEVRSFSNEAHRRLAGNPRFDHLCDEIRDLQEELSDLECAIHEATFRPHRWRRVARRAEEVAEDVCDVREELDHLLRDRRPVFIPHTFQNSHARFARPTFSSHRGFGIALQIGNGRPSIQLVPNTPVTHQFGARHFGHPNHFVGRPVVQHDPCNGLRARLATMQSLANQIVALTSQCR